MGRDTTNTRPTQKDTKATDNRKGRVLPKVINLDRLFLGNEDQQGSSWSATFLPSIAICLLVLGITLIAIGSVNNKADVIVLGVMFLLGSIMFFGLMYGIVCKPLCHRNQVENFTYIDTAQPAEAFIPRSVSQPLANSEAPSSKVPYQQHTKGQYHMNGKPGLVPRDSVLYSAKSRSFVATPATAKDVTFDEGLETPPPPRVSLQKSMLVDGSGPQGADDSFDELGVGGQAVFDPDETAPGPAVYNDNKGATKEDKKSVSLSLI